MEFAGGAGQMEVGGWRLEVERLGGWGRDVRFEEEVGGRRLRVKVGGAEGLEVGGWGYRR